MIIVTTYLLGILKGVVFIPRPFPIHVLNARINNFNIWLKQTINCSKFKKPYEMFPIYNLTKTFKSLANIYRKALCNSQYVNNTPVFTVK